MISCNISLMKCYITICPLPKCDPNDTRRGIDQSQGMAWENMFWYDYVKKQVIKITRE